MKKLLFVIPFLFLGCATSNKVEKFTKCMIHNIPAPFWICYQSAFTTVGKTYTKKFNRLSQNEAYADGVSILTKNILLKTEKFLEKLNIKNKNILKQVKSYIITTSIDDGNWYDEKNHILYVKVTIDNDAFKQFLFSLLKGYNKKELEIAFDESF